MMFLAVVIGTKLFQSPPPPEDTLAGRLAAAEALLGPCKEPMPMAVKDKIEYLFQHSMASSQWHDPPYQISGEVSEFPVYRVDQRPGRPIYDSAVCGMVRHHWNPRCSFRVHIDLHQTANGVTAFSSICRPR